MKDVCIASKYISIYSVRGVLLLLSNFIIFITLKET